MSTISVEPRRALASETVSAVITAASLVVVALMETPLAGQTVTGTVTYGTVFLIADIAACVFFWWEYFAGLRTCQDRRQYTMANIVNLLGAIPIVASLRWLRLLRLLRLLRFLRFGAVLIRVWRRWSSSLGSQPLTSLGIASFVMIVFGTAGFYHFEGTANPDVSSYWDAVWWTFVSATTVGYGDLFPVTVGGRLVALIVFVVGIGLIGSFTAAVATRILLEPSEELPDLPEIVERLDRIEQLLTERKPA